MQRINVLIPMAGRGSRFRQAGFDVPKPMIPVDGQPMINWALKSFASFESDHKFIFIALREDLDQGLRDLLEDRGEIITLDEVTQGAVESALSARELIDSPAPLLIANCDQFIEWDVNEWVRGMSDFDAGVLAFRSTNPHHSYIAAKDRVVTEVREKEVISDLAVAGVYYYSSGKLFVAGAESLIKSGDRTNGEFYISPVFNELIKIGCKVTYGEIDASNSHMIGTPEELSRFELTLRGRSGN